MQNIDALTLKCLSDLGCILKDVTRTQSALANLIGGRPANEVEKKQLQAQTEEAEVQVELLVRKVERLRASIGEN